MTTLLPVESLDAFTSTRDGLHRIAEHVLAKARWVDNGEIRLMAFAGGFATPLMAGDRRVRVDGVDLVVDDPSGSRRIELTTIGASAAFVGVEPGMPGDVYPPATPLAPDRPLHLDRGAAQALAAWFGFTAEVLEVFAATLADANPSPMVLWPEHFDHGFSTNDAIELRRANYGASPGDDGHPEPYLYVGPWGTVTKNEFWNAEHFNGAVLPLSSLVAAADSAAAAQRFLRTARALLEGD